MTGSTYAMMPFCAALGVAALVIAASHERSSQGDHADPPAYSTTFPPQTTVPSMQAAYELAPVIADVISAHCPGATARKHFVRACLGGHWYEAKSMIEGMLARPGI